MTPPKLTPLLPCPFCGKPATWATTHHVACGNESCALGLSEFLCWDHQWNTRAPALSPPGMGEIEAAMNHAFSLGQTYWQQADSDSYKQNAKSVETRDKFDVLLENTLTLIRTALAAPRVPDAVPKTDIRPLCYSCGCRSDHGRDWQGRSICSKCRPRPPASEGEGK